MAYTAPQIGTILLKADRTMYKIGQIAYENMFAEDNEALDYERDIIFIYKKAVEFADDFFIGTEKLDKVVERLAAKISAYDYGELNPIYADAALLNISTVVAGAALNDLTDVTIANLLDNQFLRYNAATGQWVNVGPGSAVRNSQAFTATAGQTVFTTSFPFDAGLLDLYINGVKINSLSYTTMGEYQITLTDGCAAGDIVDVVIYDPSSAVLPPANSLNDLTDVNLGPLVNKQALYYNSTSGLWENGQVFVPYTGAVANTDLGEFEMKAGQFTLDTSPTGVASVGTTRWNDATGTSETTLKGGNVTLKTGVDLVARIVNKVTPNTTLTKASYQAVRVSGAQGQRLAVAFAQANNDANSADTIGIVCETIATNQEGFIMTVGQLENINTTGSLQGETWADGDVLYLSPTTPGALTNIKPNATVGHIVVMGYVEYAHINNGKIYVKIMNGWELDELHNVNINVATLANGDVLKYNSTTQLWENGQPTGGISGSGASGQVAYWTGTSAQSGSNNLFWDNGNGRLGIGTNVPSAMLHLSGTGAALRITRTGTVNDESTIILNNTANTAGGQIRALMGSGGIRFTNYNALTEYARFTASDNFHIGAFTSDSGQRLQVQGDVFIKGSGNTFTTTALTVQNSAGTGLLSLSNSGELFLFGTSNTIIQPTNTNLSSPVLSGTNIMFYNYTASQVATVGSYIFNGANLTQTSGNSIVFNILKGVAPSSGTGTFSLLALSSTINQQGGANGITRGLYVNPTITAAADWRSVETSNNTGWAFYGAGTAPSQLGGALTVAGGLTLSSGSLSLPLAIHSLFGGLYRIWFRGSSRWTFESLNPNIGFEFKHSMSSGNAFNIVSPADVSQFLVSGAGNTILNSTLDSGERLQVQGTTLLNGNVTFSSATGMFWDATNSRLGIGTNTPAAAYKLDVVGAIRASTYLLSPAFYASSDLLFGISGGTGAMRITTNRNLQIFDSVTPADSGERLQVTGTMKVTGNATMSGFIFTSTSSNRPWFAAVNGINTPLSSGTALQLNLDNSDSRTATGFDFLIRSGTRDYTSGSVDVVRLTANFTPTSGTGVFTNFTINPTINQTGGANGITRGLYILPTLTAAADFRAIETTAGNVLFGSNFFWDNTNSRLGIGTATPSGIWSGNNRSIQITAPANFASELVLSRPVGAFGAASITHFLSGTGVDLFGVYTASTTSNYAIYTNSNERLRIWTTGNVSIGAGNNPSDSGERLQVTGTALLNGFTKVRGTTNNDTTSIFRVEQQNTNGRFVVSANGQVLITGDAFASTENFVTITRNNFNPTSGTGTHTSLFISPTINQTGGANGISRGLYISPTLTSAADFRAIETTNGKVIFGNLPTSSAGLPTGAIWNDAGTIKIV